MKKNNIILTIISIVMFLFGVLIFFYPTISNYIANEQFKNVIKNYDDVSKEANEEDLSLEYEKALEYNKTLVGDAVYDPFIPGTGYALPKNYNELLNLKGDGVMGYIEIPKINVKLPIYHSSSEEVLEKGVGHLETSALPIGGAGNNPVFTGHRGLPRAELFTRLDELKNNDLIYLHILNDILAYEVDNVVVLLPSKLSELGAYKEKDIITLITCTPYGINTHRLVVQAHRVEYIPSKKEKIQSSKIVRLSESFGIRIVGTILGVVVLIIILYLLNRRKKVHNNKELAANANIPKVVQESNISKKIVKTTVNNNISNKPKKKYKKKKRSKYENKN